MNRQQILLTAIRCHEANKAYCESIGDFSQKSWGDAEQWQRDSAIKGVEYHVAHPDSTPADSHNSWLKEKEATGWKYGPVKDVEKKEHPCFVPYEQLPEQQKFKDALFVHTVRSCQAMLSTAFVQKEHFHVLEEGCSYVLPNYEVVDGVGIVEVDNIVSGQVVSFVRGSKVGTENVDKRIGTLHEHLLAMMIHDLKYKNNLVPSREGALVITKLEEALGWLRQRQIDRMARGVAGTYQR